MTGFEAVVTIATGVVILVGIAGTMLPILPGLLLIWAAVVGYGLFVDHGVAGWTAVTLATMLAGIGLFLNVRIPQRSASASGMSVSAQIVALILAVLGFFLVPVVGFPLGFVLGTFLMRLRTTGDTREAWISTRKTLVALLKASAAQALCGIGMFVVWLGWAVTVALR